MSTAVCRFFKELKMIRWTRLEMQAVVKEKGKKDKLSLSNISILYLHLLLLLFSPFWCIVSCHYSSGIQRWEAGYSFVHTCRHDVLFTLLLLQLLGYGVTSRSMENPFQIIFFGIILSRNPRIDSTWLFVCLSCLVQVH